MTVPQILIDKVAESQFDGKPEWEVADLLNAPDAALPKKKVPILTQHVRQFLLGRSFWPAIVIAADDTTIDQNIRGLCITVRDIMKIDSIIQTDETSAYNIANTMLTSLVSAGLINQATKDDLIALTDATQSWAEYNNLPTVTSRDVGLARGAVA
jgi:hypothetical protein